MWIFINKVQGEKMLETEFLGMFLKVITNFKYEFRFKKTPLRQ